MKRFEKIKLSENVTVLNTVAMKSILGGYKYIDLYMCTCTRENSPFPIEVSRGGSAPSEYNNNCATGYQNCSYYGERLMY